jgi:hydroxymethylbilane synthase
LNASRVLRVGTRGSRLALWQANAVSRLLETAGRRPEIVVIKTTGDHLQQRPATALDDGHKRHFVKELEEALIADAIDIAVHSAKDLPVDMPESLTVAGCLAREDPRDALVVRQPGASGWRDALATLRPNAVIGTSSVRRLAQLRPMLRDATFAPMRGNVDTRLRKLDAGDFDALVLACAGLCRLGLEERISAAIPLDECVPAPGQGIVAMEIRAGDADARAIVESIHDEAAGRALAAERAVVTAVGGGCQLPLGAVAVHDDGGLEMRAAVASPDGSRMVRSVLRGRESAPVELGRRVAEDLLAQGAGEILSQLM